MEKLCTFLIIYSLFIAATNATPKEDEKPAHVLHFYVHNLMGGPKPTAYEVARANITSNSTTSFGQVHVMDHMITAGRDRDSMELGRAQGLDASVDLRDTALAMNIVFVFTTGPFNGTTLGVSGRKSVTSKDAQEMPVVGGTGVFRMARGYSISNTIFYDPVEKYAVLEYDVYLY